MKSHLAVVAVALLGVAGGARGAVILNFKAVPTSPAHAEFTWNGAALNESTGSIGNGDGTSPLGSQMAPGLQFDTPFIINGVPGSSVNAASGTTTFFDGSLAITGFTAVSPAQNVGVLVQPLGGGDFTLTSTTGMLLLHGTVTGSTITGSAGGSAGAVFSAANVTYDSGLIYNALVSQGGSIAGNDFSFSFVDVNPTFGAAPSAALNPFTANGSGLFNVVVLPEPGSAAVLAIAGAGLLMRRRRSA